MIILSPIYESVYLLNLSCNILKKLCHSIHNKKINTFEYMIKDINTGV